MRIKLFFKYLFNYDKFIILINKIIQPNPMIDLIISQDLLFASVLGIGHSFVVSLLNSRVPKPYMDEEFHIGQTRLYCQGIYDQWDPLITTPPALYILAAFLGFCGRERFFNSMLVPICYFGFCRLRRKYLYESNAKIQQQKWKEKQFQTVHLPVLSTILLPILFDTSFLFYTDLLSLTAVVWALSSICPFHSFLAFTLAILARQTNILWAAFYCFPFVLEEFTKFWNGQSSFSRSFFQLIRRTFLHIILAICFLLFIFWNNGSIVLGDKSAHRPVFHSPQLLYFFLFTGASSFPVFIANFAQNYNKIFNRRYIFLFLAFSIFAFLSVHFCTMAHPYLLADNRHFTFYIWQRIFQRHWMFKYLLVPIYAIIALFMFEMATLMSKFTKFTFLFSTAFCLIPAKLLEFRYFIIPFTIWRLSLEHNIPKWALIMEIGFHLTVNILSLYLFLERPFKWANEPEEWQRFMW